MKTYVFALCLIACTGSDDDIPAADAGGGDAAAWVGNWSSAGTQSTTCGAQSSTTQISDLVVVTEGAAAGTIKTSANNCALIWNLDGNTAALQAGQSCTVSVDGFNITVTWTQSTATLGDDIIVANTTGATNNGCSFMQQTTLTRMR